MTDQPLNLVLEHLKAIRTKLDSIGETLRDHTARLGAIEARLVAVEQRMGLWNERLARIEARLELEPVA